MMIATLMALMIAQNKLQHSSVSGLRLNGVNILTLSNIIKQCLRLTDHKRDL